MHHLLIFRKIHKWLGLILGLQILLWFLSGFLMSFMAIDEVRGNHLLKELKPTTIELNQVDLSAITDQVSAPIKSVEIKSWLDQTVVAVDTTNGSWLFETPSMQAITSLSEPVIRRIVTEQLKGDVEILSITKMMEVPNEVRGRAAPLWQVQLAGDENARIYISEQSGEITAKRTDKWRLFDFMWMLHIMDYDERSDFNHPLLYLTALSALLFTLTGFVLLYFTLRRKRKTPQHST